MIWSELIPGDVLHGEPIELTTIWVVTKVEYAGHGSHSGTLLEITMMRLDDGSGKQMSWVRAHGEPVEMANVILAAREGT